MNDDKAEVGNGMDRTASDSDSGKADCCVIHLGSPHCQQDEIFWLSRCAARLEGRWIH